MNGTNPKYFEENCIYVHKPTGEVFYVIRNEEIGDKLCPIHCIQVVWIGKGHKEIEHESCGQVHTLKKRGDMFITEKDGHILRYTHDDAPRYYADECEVIECRHIIGSMFTLPFRDEHPVAEGYRKEWDSFTAQFREVQ